jgi:glucose-6-phosphate isomerase
MPRLPHVAYDHCLSDHDLTRYEHALTPALETMKRAAGGMNPYDEDQASINLPIDTHHRELCQKLARKYKDVTLLVVVGIGGSNLGTMAIQEAVLGHHHNLDPGKRPRVLYADTVDPHRMAFIASQVNGTLKAKKKVLLNVISKSGGTTETIANFEILYKIMQDRLGKKAKDYVVATTDEGSHLWEVAHREGFARLPNPKKVGGRYSVLSPVGLFPLAVMGIDIGKLMDGAAHMRTRCLKDGHGENPAIVRAALLANAKAHRKHVADHFCFATDLECVGKWYRQLMGESVGKEWNKQHTVRVHQGLTPTVSLGSTDLHSMAQLYFGGPDDKIFTILTVEQWRHAPTVPNLPLYDALVPHIQRKPLPVIMDAISGGVKATLTKLERPYCEIILPDMTEHTIGALLQLHMMEMMFLATLLGVNAFDQPNVEEYKIETKRLLARK